MPIDGSFPTRVFGDNLSVILNAHNPAADLSKKRIDISFHTVCEAIASKITDAYFLKGKYNLNDITINRFLTPLSNHIAILFIGAQTFICSNKIDLISCTLNIHKYYICIQQYFIMDSCIYFKLYYVLLFIVINWCHMMTTSQFERYLLC